MVLSLCCAVLCCARVCFCSSRAQNQQHLDSFDHPPAEGDVDDEDDAGEDADAIAEGGPNEPRNKDMPDDPNDKDYDPKDGPAGNNKNKRARTDKAASPGAAAAASSPAASPTKAVAVGAGAAQAKACYYGSACYNKDPDHVRRFSHPAPPPPPRTKEEFIETTNQSQHDLAEYYVRLTRRHQHDRAGAAVDLGRAAANGSANVLCCVASACVCVCVILTALFRNSAATLRMTKSPRCW